MARDFWHSLEVMVQTLEGNRASCEKKLDELEEQLFSFPKSKRLEIRHDLQIVVSQLARLTTRVKERDGD